jgi:hypothetical protein
MGAEVTPPPNSQLVVLALKFVCLITPLLVSLNFLVIPRGNPHGDRRVA